MVKWEYLVENTNMMNMGDLEEFGANGWELAGFEGPHAYFKRPVKPQMPAILVVNNIPSRDFPQLLEDIGDALEQCGFEREGGDNA